MWWSVAHPCSSCQKEGMHRTEKLEVWVQESHTYSHDDLPSGSVLFPRSLPPQSPSDVVQHARLLAYLSLQPQPASSWGVLGRYRPASDHNSGQGETDKGRGRGGTLLKHNQHEFWEYESKFEGVPVLLVCFVFANSRVHIRSCVITAPHMMVATLDRKYV